LLVRPTTECMWTDLPKYVDRFTKICGQIYQNMWTDLPNLPQAYQLFLWVT
jgi:hypothetical protein